MMLAEMLLDCINNITLRLYSSERLRSNLQQEVIQVEFLISNVKERDVCLDAGPEDLTKSFEGKAGRF